LRFRYGTKRHPYNFLKQVPSIISKMRPNFLKFGVYFDVNIKNNITLIPGVWQRKSNYNSYINLNSTKIRKKISSLLVSLFSFIYNIIQLVSRVQVAMEPLFFFIILQMFLPANLKKLWLLYIKLYGDKISMKGLEENGHKKFHKNDCN
jgi:hypothetical protein